MSRIFDKPLILKTWKSATRILQFVDAHDTETNETNVHVHLTWLIASQTIET